MPTIDLGRAIEKLLKVGATMKRIALSAAIIGALAGATDWVITRHPDQSFPLVFLALAGGLLTFAVMIRDSGPVKKR